VEQIGESWTKRAGFWLASRAFCKLLQIAPRTQNLRVLDMSDGLCPPFGPMRRPAILVMWHECIGLTVGLGFHSPVTLLVSQHRDANWLTAAAQGMGFDIVRGSTTRGGGAALRKLKELSTTHSMVITPDGPKGPRRVMSMGAVYLASLLQLPIVPVGVGMRNPWRLNTWDRFAVPKPGQRARIIFGPTIEVPRKCGRDVLDQYAAAIGQDLDQVNDVAEAWANRDDEIQGARRLNWRGQWVPAAASLHDRPAPEVNGAVRKLSGDTAVRNPTPSVVGAPDHASSTGAPADGDRSTIPLESRRSTSQPAA